MLDNTKNNTQQKTIKIDSNESEFYEYKGNTIIILNKINNQRSLKLIYEYVEYLFLKYEAD